MIGILHYREKFRETDKGHTHTQEDNVKIQREHHVKTEDWSGTSISQRMPEATGI